MTTTPQNNIAPFVFFGTPYVARDTLALLDARGWRPALVVTSPDAPRGRHLTLTPSEVRVWADERGIPVITPEKIDDATIATIRSAGCGYAVVVAYGKILPQALLDIFPHGVLNIHYSLLPKYRGASPVEAALLNGDAETGVTFQRMIYKLDAGDIIAQERTAIGADETTVELRARLIVLGAELALHTLPAYLAGDIAPVSQDEALATRAAKIKKEDGDITHNDDATRWRKYRAYAQWPCTFFFAQRDDKHIRVKIASAHEDGGRFVIDSVVPEGKREMPYADFLRTVAAA